MSVGGEDAAHSAQRTSRRAARQIVGEYHEQQLRVLLDHVRQGFVGLDRGEIDAFELDELIERYGRAVRRLGTFCGATGADCERAAGALQFMRDNGEAPDWWDVAARDRR